MSKQIDEALRAVHELNTRSATPAPQPAEAAPAELDFMVVDQHGGVWVYQRTRGYHWAWALHPGTVDADNHDLLEVWRIEVGNPDAEAEQVALFPRPAMVGEIDPDVPFKPRGVPSPIHPYTGGNHG